MTSQRKTLLNKGFTLIELLIVIAILGVLAVVVVVAINPVEQLARARDAGRSTAITQLGHSLQAYATARGGNYPTESSTWIDTLVSAGEVGAAPAKIDYSISGVTACTTNRQNNYCYDTNGSTPPTNSIVFSRLESKAQNSRCASGDAYTVYDTISGRGGVVCSATEPSFNASGQTYTD